ncbi:SH3 domain-containing protein [Lachnotalea sp. AF33-28]|uniref:SH3 domain-containing protein n=1 Tax=Lachnotalea sp. AF33-28 TaxID=2292046 RepID=UPI000E4989F9|nr:SH3 domain-containing protein [Lachnotalea sp. AF33-28]RHP32737.1 hypothetical protein DWZ56_12460 [Lachnotalea sp. AF33-28]
MQFKIDKKFIEKYGKYMILGAVALLLVIILIVSALTKKPEVPAGQTVEPTTDEAVTEPAETEPPLQEDAYPEINKLFETYFTAKKELNVDQLNSIVVQEEPYTLEEIEKEGEYIENYQNIKCYTKPGLQDNTYLVYVYFEIKFMNIDTPAPGMVQQLVCMNSDGTLYINAGKVDADVKSYMDEVYNSQDVRALITSVEEKLQQAMSADENLLKLVDKLREGADTGTTPPETEPEQTQPPETQPEQTQPSETEPAETQPEQTQPSETQASETTAAPSGTTTVYAKQNVKIRKEPSTDSEEVGKLTGAASIERISDDGTWSKVLYNGAECYIMSDLLTTVKPDTAPFTATDETVYATTDVKIRKGPSTDSEEVATLKAGDSIKRTAYNDEWSKVEYKGNTYYVATPYLSRQRP